MKIVFSFLSIAFFILFSAEKISAQNLVLNSSFEDTVTCPNSTDQIYNAQFWTFFSESPDYFNKCSTDTFLGQTFVSVPTNYFGFQYAMDGQAYAGLGTYHAGGDIREIIGGTLSIPLTIGVKYYSGMRVCSSESSQFASNKLGISFSTVLYQRDTAPVSINNYAVIYSNTIITDTLNWTTVSGSFIADSAYNYIMLGNFFNDANTSIQNVNPSAIFSETYYYVDAVYVSTDSLCCYFSEGIRDLPQQQIAIYPNPATEQLIIDNARLPVGPGQLIIKGIELFDLVGRKMVNDDLLVNNSNHYSLNTKNFPRGYYFVRINTSEGIINRKIVLQ